MACCLCGRHVIIPKNYELGSLGPHEPISKIQIFPFKKMKMLKMLWWWNFPHWLHRIATSNATTDENFLEVAFFFQCWTYHWRLLSRLLFWYHVILPNRGRQWQASLVIKSGINKFPAGQDTNHPTNNATHWGRVTHIWVSKLTIIGSDNGLSPGRRQAIIWTNAGILFIGSLGTKFNEILIGIQIVSFTKMHLKMSSAKWVPFCLGLNV